MFYKVNDSYIDLTKVDAVVFGKLNIRYGIFNIILENGQIIEYKRELKSATFKSSMYKDKTLLNDEKIKFINQHSNGEYEIIRDDMDNFSIFVKNPETLECYGEINIKKEMYDFIKILEEYKSDNNLICIHCTNADTMNKKIAEISNSNNIKIKNIFKIDNTHYLYIKKYPKLSNIENNIQNEIKIPTITEFERNIIKI